MKRTITKELMDLTSYSKLDGPIDQVIENLIALRDEYAATGEYELLHIEEDWAGYDGGYRYILRGKRPETDEEYATRDLAEKKRQALQEEQERQLFAKLAEKYGDK